MSSSTQPKPRPPRRADQVLEWFCAPHLLEEIQGDLHEEFVHRVVTIGERKARWHYWREVIGFVRPFVLKRRSEYASSSLFCTDMLHNYLTSAWRNLVRQKMYSVITIAGLSTDVTWR